MITIVMELNKYLLKFLKVYKYIIYVRESISLPEITSKQIEL